jgi:hypothetical protein
LRDEALFELIGLRVTITHKEILLLDFERASMGGFNKSSRIVALVALKHA